MGCNQSRSEDTDEVIEEKSIHHYGINANMDEEAMDEVGDDLENASDDVQDAMEDVQDEIEEVKEESQDQ